MPPAGTNSDAKEPTTETDLHGFAVGDMVVPIQMPKSQPLKQFIAPTVVTGIGTNSDAKEPTTETCAAFQEFESRPRTNSDAKEPTTETDVGVGNPMSV